MGKTRWTLVDAAAVAGCHQSTIRRLVRAGKLQAEKKGRAHVVLAERSKIRAEVAASAPRSGFHKTAAKGGGPRGGSALALLASFLAVPEAKRGLTLRIAERFTVEELKLIVRL